MKPIVEHYPRIHEFAIGQSRDDPDRQLIIVEKIDTGIHLGPFFGMVENLGEVNDITFSVSESVDNDITDAWSTVNIRVGGANVVSLVVVPGGKAVFAIEGSLEAYLRFNAAPDDSWGRLVLTYFGGDIERREREKVV